LVLPYFVDLGIIKNKETMTLELYTELKNEIEIRWDKADQVLKSFVDPNTGRVEDIKNEDYRKAKRAYDLVFNEVRTLAKHTPKKIQLEYSLRKRFNN
jgi:hypothetical protein